MSDTPREDDPKRLSRRLANLEYLLGYICTEVTRITTVPHDSPSDVVHTVQALLTDAESHRDRVAALQAELAPLRALAVEASSRPNLPPESTMAEAHGLTLQWYAGVIDRLAAHATPNQEPTP